MTKSYFTLLAIVSAGYFFTASNAGVATVQNKDRTGSPVGTTGLCNSCHNGGAFTTSIQLRMVNGSGNVVTTYVPGQSYTYEVELTSTGAVAYGFQTVGLIAATNASAGTLTALSSNTKTVVLGGRTYGEHTSRSSDGLFKMTWTAPPAGSGEVNFYATGVGCNANSGTSGDKYVKATALTLTEDVSATVAENQSPVFTIYPVPAGQTLYLRGDYAGPAKWLVTDMSGKIIQAKNCIFVSGSVTGMDVRELGSGTFVLVLLDSNGNKIYSSTFIKE